MSPGVQVSKIYTKEELCFMERIPEPCSIVIFGASGDLAFRKLLPSLFYLHENGLLPKQYNVIGAARTPFSDEEFRKKVRRVLPSSAPSAKLEDFLRRLSYASMDYADASFYENLKKTLQRLDTAGGAAERRLFYLSTPPFLYPVVIGNLAKAGLAGVSARDSGWTRVVIEKPFGTDLASAKTLNRDVHRAFREDQVYRIDHYLGKETVQNLLVLRFANSLFEPAWNRDCIDHVQITAAEQLGVEHRAGYYDKAGALRDMFQNHLLQLLTLIAMEPPVRFEADAVRDKKLDVLESIRPLEEAGLDRCAARAQYSAGSIDGQAVPAYREEEGVPRDSATPTFAALRLEVDNWRWKGVPFYLRSGKRMAERTTEIAVRFKHVPVSIFRPLLADQLSANVLRLRIQPREGISLLFEAKHPGPKLCLSTVDMRFDYQESFGTPPPEAYARLFLDAMIGDQTLFARSDAVERAWELLDPLLTRWEEKKDKELFFYPAGTWGPPRSDELLARDGRKWDLPYGPKG